MAFVEHAKRRAERNLQELEATLEQLRDADDETADAIMAGEASRAMKFHEEEIASQQVRSGGASLLPRIQAHAHQGGSPEALNRGLTPNSKSNMEARLRAMGAIPALGGLMRSHSAAGRVALQPTDSPAARELSRRLMNGVSDGSEASDSNVAMASSRSPSQEVSNPPWQEEVRLRQLRPVAYRAAEPQMDHVNEELSAMFAKRQALK